MGQPIPSLSRPAGALSPAEGAAIALEINRRAGENPLYHVSSGDGKAQQTPGNHMSWRISPSPYALPQAIYRQFEALGTHLLAFQRAANKLYYDSVKGKQPSWVHEVLDRGKPEALIDYQRMNRFKKLTPMVIRPDLVLTDEGRLVACELDSVPGGIGFTGSMSADYAELGFEPIGGKDGLVTGFARMIRDVAGQASPFLAMVVSEESSDYWKEQEWVGARLNELGLETVVVRPQELLYAEDGFEVELDGARRRVDVVYRFFELFDLKNIPKAELVQYANKKEQVIVTPPYKAFLEEKLTFALYHHPVLRPFWLAELGAESCAALDSVLPRTWIVDPTPLPPQAVIPGLSVNGVPLTNWLDLVKTNKKERAFVLKPSGFSSLAWGSHGVSFGHDLSSEDWEVALKQALASFETTPYILQEFHKPTKTTVSYYHFGQQEVVQMGGRARFCPYYYVIEGEARLQGVLTTICPLDKLAIHGMVDSVMVPAMVAP